MIKLIDIIIICQRKSYVLLIRLTTIPLILVIVIDADTSTPFISGTTHVYTPRAPDGVPPTMASLTCSVWR